MRGRPLTFTVATETCPRISCHCDDVFSRAVSALSLN
jgi:hypothetical protein